MASLRHLTAGAWCLRSWLTASACDAEESIDGGMDADYASAASEADDEATLEEEDALAAQDGLDQKACYSEPAHLQHTQKELGV